MPVKVLITDPVDKTLIEKLSQYNVQIDYKPEIERDELLKVIGDYDVLVVRSRTKVDKEVIEKGTNLKVIARAGIGLDNIDTDEAEKRKIKVVYAPGASTDSAAELTIGLLLVAARNLYDSIGLAKSGVFKKTQGIELAGKTIGIIGFGRIGSKVGQVAKAIGMHVLAYDVLDVRERARQVGAEVVDLQELLRRSDVISLHVTVGKSPPKILDAKAFELVKQGVIIVNTSRAVVVDGPALLKSLNEGKVGVYATDVFWNEPPKEPWEWELLKHPRVIVTPHIGAQTKEAQLRVAQMTADNLITALKELGLI
ncbi:MAG: NAD(P)-dependent oxidoreductase [Thermoprotei archaeon]